MFTVERFGLVLLREDKTVLGIRSSLCFYGVLHFWGSSNLCLKRHPPQKMIPKVLRI